MALDSTGSYQIVNVPCFLCEKTELSFEAYKPEYGHDGHTLHLPFCMAPHDTEIKNIDGANLFKVLPFNEKNVPPLERPWMMVWFEKYELLRSYQPYHYGGYPMPKFGYCFGEILFVCCNCSVNEEELVDSLKRSLSDKWFEKVNRIAEQTITELFMAGGFTPKTTTVKRALKKLKTSDRSDLEKEIKELTELVSGIQQTRTVRRFKDQFKPCRKAVE